MCDKSPKSSPKKGSGFRHILFCSHTKKPWIVTLRLMVPWGCYSSSERWNRADHPSLPRLFFPPPFFPLLFSLFCALFLSILPPVPRLSFVRSGLSQGRLLVRGLPPAAPARDEIYLPAVWNSPNCHSKTINDHKRHKKFIYEQLLKCKLYLRKLQKTFIDITVESHTGKGVRDPTKALFLHKRVGEGEGGNGRLRRSQ